MKRRKRDLDEAVPRPPAELIDELAIHIADGRNVLFITGAGLSVSAGIPAFRSGAGAVWEENVVQYGTRKSLRKDPVEWHNAFWQRSSVSHKFGVLRRFHVIQTRRLPERLWWVVSFPILSLFAQAPDLRDETDERCETHQGPRRLG